MMQNAEEKNQALFEKTNPVYNTAKTTLFQLARNGNPYAAAIAKKMGLTADTQKSKSYGMTPEEETTLPDCCGNTLSGDGKAGPGIRVSRTC